MLTVRVIRMDVANANPTIVELWEAFIDTAAETARAEVKKVTANATYIINDLDTFTGRAISSI